MFIFSKVLPKNVALVLSSLWLAIVAWLILQAVKQRGLLPRLTPASVVPFGSAAALGLDLAAARHFRIAFYYGFLSPLGYTIGALTALDSVHLRLRGRVSGKGRTYS